VFERRIEHRLVLETAFVIEVGMEMDEFGHKRKYRQIRKHSETFIGLSGRA
jgi:hypothetical protein